MSSPKKKKAGRKPGKQNRTNQKPAAKRTAPLLTGKLMPVLMLLLFAEAFLLYFNTRDHDYVLDDMSVIESNWVVKRGTEGIPIIWKTSYRYGYWNNQGSLYRPLSLVMFALEWELSPDNPSVHHWVNIVLYGILAVLMFLFLQAIFRDRKPYLAFIITALYIAHPIHTEVVANIKSRDELLSFVLLLGSLVLMLRHIDKAGLWRLVTSILVYFLAFLSKESAITFLAIIPLTLWFFRDIPLKKVALTTLLYVPAAIAYIAIRGNIIGNAGGIQFIDPIDNFLVNLEGAERFATAIKIVGLYMWKLILPHPLSNDYSLAQIDVAGISDPKFLLSMLAIVGLGILAYRGWKSKSIYTYAILFFAASISLYTNLIIMIGTNFGERLLFIPSFAFVMAVGALLKKGLKAKEGQASDVQNFLGNSRQMTTIVTGLIILIYGYKTIDRNKAWAENMVLYATDVETSSNSARSHYYYGLGTMKQAVRLEDENEKLKGLKESVSAFERAIEIYPRYGDALGALGLAHYRLNDHDKALEFYQKARELTGGTAIMLNNMAVIYFNRGQREKALEIYKEVVKKDPRYVDGLRGIASCYGTLGDHEKAVMYFKEAIKYAPSSGDLYYYLGLTYNNMGNKAEAKKAYDMAKQLNPKIKTPF